MKTLYDLLGALPNDDAEGLRSAFRRSVKGAHPDLRPGDPDAALKFRQIVRANEILGDPEQRAAYDDLLEVARLEQTTAREHPIAARIHKLASGVIALTGASAVTVGGYLLFMHMSAASVASADNIAVAMRAFPTKSESTSFPGQVTAPGDAMSEADDGSVPAADAGPTLDLSAGTVRSLRARGLSALRNASFSGRTADFDQAVQIDPKFLPAYVDRGILFFRMRKVAHAFPDAARAKRIEKARPPKSVPTVARKSLFDIASATPSSQRRAAMRDQSREEGFLRR